MPYISILHYKGIGCQVLCVRVMESSRKIRGMLSNGQGDLEYRGDLSGISET